MPIMPMPPSSIGSGGPPSSSPPPPSSSYGGSSESLLSQPTGGEQMSDPKVIIATVFQKMMELIDAVNTSFPGGEDKISSGLQEIGMGFSEKVQMMGGQEPPPPSIPA